ncbi:hypothetical protein GLOIN_2v1676025 [Rhizophagus irregularis DAOM 181602=DAOM 197198]|uniref:Uncharacterized protein n=1 Tax=Rhizophagus irregularis (strain DAOM 181602 / DAOM 197198 / MUCL 43194) TaxID=747089 RepID=A0A2P4PGB7_RHIID|nr:hypothetical protein GLOIN_2v1676025 [Rhizophagus irregularis DAOM 181602=DAOM 197198]POG64438.1 hypothetical protein GLOIN_2v1676025 [Rhizophagus irregularis DAOM 181602=DAOM 197198]|eukprot:XP_025171304.1 hypothetical protein GLOIN_2v1676025 [Rhizophagus irregularis DAOM 181602=DAOM 197198]
MILFCLFHHSLHKIIMCCHKLSYISTLHTSILYHMNISFYHLILILRNIHHDFCSFFLLLLLIHFYFVLSSLHFVFLLNLCNVL